MKALALSLCLLTSFATFAKSNVEINPAFKKAAIEEFLKEANDKNSVLGKRLATINDETTDGRNADGTITLPVTRADIQVALLGSEQITNPWHYANKSEDGLSCAAGGDSANFIILLSTNTGVHMAHEFGTIPFSVSVSEELSAKAKDGSKIESCEDVAYDDTNSYILAPTQISVDSIKEMNVSEKTEN